jgi:hypothetical protein
MVRRIYGDLPLSVSTLVSKPGVYPLSKPNARLRSSKCRCRGTMYQRNMLQQEKRECVCRGDKAGAFSVDFQDKAAFARKIRKILITLPYQLRASQVNGRGSSYRIYGSFGGNSCRSSRRTYVVAGITESSLVSRSSVRCEAFF